MSFLNYLLSGCGVTVWLFSHQNSLPNAPDAASQWNMQDTAFKRATTAGVHLRCSTALFSLLCYACTWPGIAHIPANRLSHSYLDYSMPPESQAHRESNRRLGNRGVWRTVPEVDEEIIFTQENKISHFFFIYRMTLMQSFIPLNLELLTRAKLRLW